MQTCAKFKQQVELLDTFQFLGVCELVYALDDQIYIQIPAAKPKVDPTSTKQGCDMLLNLVSIRVPSKHRDSIADTGTDTDFFIYKSRSFNQSSYLL